MKLNLQGKKALITGASRGIGKAISETLASEGCSLTLAARDEHMLGRVATELSSSYGVDVQTFAADLALQKSIEALGRACADVDILVNNAGAIPRGTIDEIDLATWRAAWDLKVFGYIGLSRLLLPRMCARKSGVIVNVIGTGAERPDPNYLAGCMGNASLSMMTQCLGGESIRHGVRVVAVLPGPIMTDRFVQGMHWRATKRYGDAARWPEILKSDLPSQRAGTPQEVAHTVAFLASDLASYTSGATIRIDGGFLGTFRLTE